LIEGFNHLRLEELFGDIILGLVIDYDSIEEETY